MRSTNKDLPGLITFQMSGGYSKRALFGIMWILSFLYGFSRLDLIILKHKCFLTKCAPHRGISYLDKQNSCELQPKEFGLI